jgi:spermidine/putrescine transport system permease protein
MLRLAVYGVPSAVILAPLLSFFVFGFWSLSGGEVVRRFTLANYAEFLREPIYLPLFVSSIRLCLLVGSIGLPLGYVVAYLAWRLPERARYLVLLLTVAPLSTSYIVKIYAMRGVLGHDGALNGLLLWLGLIDEPSRLLIFNQTAVLITMAVIYLPYAILPIFISLERIPQALLAASADLGARAGQTFANVVLPLSMPGAIVGAVFVMILALGDFLTPQMVGGNQGFTFGSVVWSQFGLAYNWPLGVALAMVLLTAALMMIGVSGALGRLMRVR